MSGPGDAAGEEPIRRLAMPLSAGDALSLRAGDMVVLDGEITITAGLPTHHRIVEVAEGRRDAPRDLRAGSLFHLGSYSRETEGGGFEVLYMNPTTSTRFNALMPGLIRHFGLRAVGGKGGLDAASVAALREVGGVYLAFVGGGAPLLSDAIRAVVAVDWNDLVSHYRLVTLRVEGLGPLTVGIDAHGNSLYGSLGEAAAARLPAILEELARDRARAGGEA